MAFIRSYQPTDEEDMIHIFRVTASPDLQEAGDPALHYASYNWARPHLMLVPEHCLVLDDGQGRAVGYLLGVPDTKTFVVDYNEHYLPRLVAEGWKKPSAQAADEAISDVALAMQRFTWNPEWLLQHEFPDLLKQFPAHLHIDILPTYQGCGWGRKLIEQILSKFQSMGVSGLHLGKVGSNFGAGRFYSKLGFSRFPETMDGGKSGELGVTRDGGVILIKRLSSAD